MATVRIPLTSRNYPGHVALIDEADLALVREFRWNVCRRKQVWYAWAHPSVTRRFHMHRLIAHAPDGVKVDHRNGDGLDNRRENLRLATDAQNCANQGLHTNNTSGYKGVTWLADRRAWNVRIAHRGKRLFIGYYHDPREGALAYDLAARELFGEFARLNFPDL